MKIAPSILAGNLADFNGELRELELAGCDQVHWDVMDGQFVPNLTFGPPVIRCARDCTGLPFDVHLMVLNPADYVGQLAGLPVEQLSFQIETTHFAPRLIKLIRDQGMSPGVALNPATPLSELEEILHLVDNVLVMSVDPGFAGQSFIEGVYAKVERLADWRDSGAHTFTIEVDGGVNETNLRELAALGVDIVVCGAAYFNAADRAALVRLVHGLP